MHLLSFGAGFTLVFGLPSFLIILFLVVLRRKSRDQKAIVSVRWLVMGALKYATVFFIAASLFLYVLGRSESHCKLSDTYEVVHLSLTYNTFLDCEAREEFEIHNLKTGTKLSYAYDDYCEIMNCVFKECPERQWVYFQRGQEQCVFDFANREVLLGPIIGDCSDFVEFKDVVWE